MRRSPILTTTPPIRDLSSWRRSSTFLPVICSSLSAMAFCCFFEAAVAVVTSAIRMPLASFERARYSSTIAGNSTKRCLSTSSNRKWYTSFESSFLKHFCRSSFLSFGSICGLEKNSIACGTDSMPSRAALSSSPYATGLSSSCAISKIALAYFRTSCKFSMADHQSCPCRVL